MKGKQTREQTSRVGSRNMNREQLKWTREKSTAHKTTRRRRLKRRETETERNFASLALIMTNQRATTFNSKLWFDEEWWSVQSSWPSPTLRKRETERKKLPSSSSTLSRPLHFHFHLRLHRVKSLVVDELIIKIIIDHHLANWSSTSSSSSRKTKMSPSD